jgi:hypothetical protein
MLGARVLVLTGLCAPLLRLTLACAVHPLQSNASGHAPYQVAQRMGFVSLAVLLR